MKLIVSFLALLSMSLALLACDGKNQRSSKRHQRYYEQLKGRPDIGIQTMEMETLPSAPGVSALCG